MADCMLRRTNYNFLGVYARDQLPMINEIDRFPACLISNTDTSDGPGVHWVAVTYVSRANLEFFDSYALQPSDYLFDSLPNSINLSLFQIQHDDSDRCGHHCLYYLFKRSHSFSLSRIYTLFSPNALSQNDQLVGHFVKHLRKLCTSSHSLSNKAFCNHACICKCKTCYCRKT